MFDLLKAFKGTLFRHFSRYAWLMYQLYRPAGKAVPAAHSLIKISPSVLSISDDTDPIPTDGEPTNTTVTVDAEDEFVDNTTVAKDTQEVGSNVVDAFTVDKETKETIVREKLPSDDEEELTVAQVAILAGVDEAVVEEPQDNAAAKEVDEREMETGNQPLQDEDEQLSVVTSNGSGASTGDTKPGSTAAVQVMKMQHTLTGVHCNNSCRMVTLDYSKSTESYKSKLQSSRSNIRYTQDKLRIICKNKIFLP